MKCDQKVVLLDYIVSPYTNRNEVLGNCEKVVRMLVQEFAFNDNITTSVCALGMMEVDMRIPANNQKVSGGFSFISTTSVAQLNHSCSRS